MLKPRPRKPRTSSRQDKIRRAASKIVAQILNEGLAKSTWRDTFSNAYDSLLSYREDIEKDVAKILSRMLL